MAGNHSEPSALEPSSNFEVFTFSPVYIEWYFWVIVLVIACALVTLVSACLLCYRKPYKTAVVRLSEEMPAHFPGTVLAPEGIIQPDVSFYTQVQPCPPGLCPGPSRDPMSPGTPCRPLEPAYQPTQLLTITTVRLPYLTCDLPLPPGYVSLRDLK